MLINMIFYNDTFRHYNGNIGLIITSSWSLLVIIFLIYLVKNNNDFFTIGPSDKIYFINIKINTWTKWSMVMIYSTLSGVSSTVTGSTIKPFITNVIRDHKSPWNIDYYWQSQTVVGIYNTYYCILNIHQYHYVLVYIFL